MYFVIGWIQIESTDKKMFFTVLHILTSMHPVPATSSTLYKFSVGILAHIQLFSNLHQQIME